MTKEKAWPATKSDDPEHVKPMSDCSSPVSVFTARMSGTIELDLGLADDLALLPLRERHDSDGPHPCGP